MRLWTLHPRYLDAAGLCALWREGLLAQKALAGETRGYRHHPQLARFRAHADPPGVIAAYLAEVCAEAIRRGYRFDGSKVGARRVAGTMEETEGQLLYEWGHLLRKLERRSPALWEAQRVIAMPEPHPLFRLVPGGVQPWEKVAGGGSTGE